LAKEPVFSDKLFQDKTLFDWNFHFNEQTNDYNKSRNHFLKDGKDMATFETAYSSKTNECTPQQIEEVNIAQDKIRAIKESEPNQARILNDIIGKKMGQWTFRYSSEIQNATITNTYRSDNSNEYAMEFLLQDYNTQNMFHAKAIIIYTNDLNTGWNYTSIRNTLYESYVNAEQNFNGSELVVISKYAYLYELPDANAKINLGFNKGSKTPCFEIVNGFVKTTYKYKKASHVGGILLSDLDYSDFISPPVTNSQIK